MHSFVFMTSVQSVQLTGVRASNLAEFHDGLEKVDGSSIYHHTHRFYRTHSYLGATPLSDFAFWVRENLREDALAEGIASLDLRDFDTIRDLRNAILAVLAPMRENPSRWERRVPPGLEFHFSRSVSLILPTHQRAHNLEEFIRAVERVDTSCLYYHLIEAPLHLQETRHWRNDFSAWLGGSLGLDTLAESVAAIDPYRRDLEGLREDLLNVLRPSRLRRMIDNILARQEPVTGVVSSFLRRSKGGE